MKTLLPWKVSDEEQEYLKSNLDDIVIFDPSELGSMKDSCKLEDFDILIAGLADERMIDSLVNLKFIQSMISGVSHIDLECAEKRGIIVSSTKGANAYSVSEHAMLLALELMKNSKTYYEQVNRNQWQKHYSEDLYGKNIGIIGYGSIGTEIARRMRSFGVRINAVRKRPQLGNNGVELDYLGDDLDYVLRNSDIIFITAPKTQETIDLINLEKISIMKEGSYLLNVSRGPIVNMQAVSYALKSHLLAGFATDVFDTEPNYFNDDVYSLRNVICTPHVAAYSHNSKIKCLEFVVNNINGFQENKKINNVVDFRLGY